MFWLRSVFLLVVSLGVYSSVPSYRLYLRFNLKINCSVLASRAQTRTRITYEVLEFAITFCLFISVELQQDTVTEPQASGVLFFLFLFVYIGMPWPPRKFSCPFFWSPSLDSNDMFEGVSASAFFQPVLQAHYHASRLATSFLRVERR